ncbi:hypothetical protein NL676_030921 [Syzygium grande]|nr:hypothetical protein NL676_030921 [Syzygium grande]
MTIPRRLFGLRNGQQARHGVRAANEHEQRNGFGLADKHTLANSRTILAFPSPSGTRRSGIERSNYFQQPYRNPSNAKAKSQCNKSREFLSRLSH